MNPVPVQGMQVRNVGKIRKVAGKSALENAVLKTPRERFFATNCKRSCCCLKTVDNVIGDKTDVSSKLPRFSFRIS